MNEVLLGLTLAYVFLTAVLLLAVISGRLHWIFKLTLLLLAIGFYWISYQGWKQAQGWPTDAVVPEQFLMHYAVVEEPDKEKGREGGIFLWLTDLKGHQLAVEPRAYRIPYDQKTHTNIQLAMKDIRNGSVQLGQRSPKPEDPVSVENKKAFGEKKYLLEFSDLPDPALPEK
ncbi:hypothetical protein ACFVYJ_01840 [Pontibacter sp. JAM-7]|uniref:hypothetical protein n=1 Tax=Pontibacter sp. JAM-7 TaxID=3366581 RepID=UPI003AF70AE0